MVKYIRDENEDGMNMKNHLNKITVFCMMVLASLCLLACAKTEEPVVLTGEVIADEGVESSMEAEKESFQELTGEIKEELSAEIEPLEIFCEYPFSYPGKEIYFYFIKAKLVSEKIEPTFHSEIKWLSPKEADLEFCPADVFAAEKIKGEYKK